jgi:hypothetical protein
MEIVFIYLPTRHRELVLIRLDYMRGALTILDHRKTKTIVFSRAALCGPEFHDVVASRLDPS